MKLRGTTLGVGIAALLFVLALFPPMAAAQRYKTTLYFDTFGLIYSSGHYDWAYVALVDAPLRGLQCVTHRNVQVYREVANAPDTLIGSQRSDFLGLAQLVQHEPDLNTLPGTYYASVGHTKIRHHHKTIRCSGDRSKTVTVSKPDFLSAASQSALTERLQARAHRSGAG